jgi:hypothetical protein
VDAEALVRPVIEGEGLDLVDGGHQRVARAGHVELGEQRSAGDARRRANRMHIP